jgi:hypothetical protein
VCAFALGAGLRRCSSSSPYDLISEKSCKCSAARKANNDSECKLRTGGAEVDLSGGLKLFSK